MAGIPRLPNHLPDLFSFLGFGQPSAGHFFFKASQRQGLLERDAENGYLASGAVDDDAMNQLLGHSIIVSVRAFTGLILPVQLVHF